MKTIFYLPPDDLSIFDRETPMYFWESNYDVKEQRWELLFSTDKFVD